MNPLQRVLIEKAGHDNGFEAVAKGATDTVVLASALHTARASVVTPESGYRVTIEADRTLVSELARSFPDSIWDDSDFDVKGDADLATLLKRASALARALPNQPANGYEQEVEKTLLDVAEGTARTEVERIVRQRIGQDKFRQALLEYWGGACAVTGVSLPEVLRASHAKPWAECATDQERLDVFNGFLLCANLDALFDRHLISFDEQGALMVSDVVSLEQLRCLGIEVGSKLRWIASEHERYLESHRLRFRELSQGKSRATKTQG
jgi:putative restriction endonuclease